MEEFLKGPQANAVRQGLSLVASTAVSVGVSPDALLILCAELMVVVTSNFKGAPIQNGGKILVTATPVGDTGELKVDVACELNEPVVEVAGE